MGNNGIDFHIERLRVRTWEPRDQGAVLDLFETGRLVGMPMPNDTAADLDNIPDAYLRNERDHFWVAEYDGQPVGMIGVAEDDSHRAEIRRLRVSPAYKGNGIAVRLLDTALKFCNKHGYLKVVLDTAIESNSAKEIFDRCSFHYNRTRTVGGKELVEFYLDLYHDPRQESGPANRPAQ